MFAKLVVSAALLTGLVAAQNNFTIDPNSVTTQLRASWCLGEISSCGTLCFGDVDTNTCTSDTLSFNCTCNNGSAPGLQYYESTMPTFICEQAFVQCIAAHPDDSAGQSACTKNIKANCGTLNPANATSTATSTSSSVASATSSASSSAATAASAASSAAASATGNAAPYGMEMGTGAIFAGAFAAFGYLL